MKPVTALAVLALAAAFTVHAAPTPQAATLTGEVLESRDVDSYTYLLLKTTQGEVWAAVPTAKVAKGASVTIGGAMTMENFTSKTLKKTFDRIVFGQLAAAPAVKPAEVHGALAVPAAPKAKEAKISKASGPDARTVAEVVQGKSALKDKTVVVRGRVVKVNNGIMGKNWLHLQDGTGSAKDGTHDILVTTKDKAAVGDVVDARGTVRTDVTVGAGYAYAVMMDNATVHK